MGGGSRRGRGRGGRSNTSGSGSGNPKTRKRGSLATESLFVEGGFLSDWTPSSSNRNSGFISFHLLYNHSFHLIHFILIYMICFGFQVEMVVPITNLGVFVEKKPLILKLDLQNLRGIQLDSIILHPMFRFV
jgi:hypothetical protein